MGGGGQGPLPLSLEALQRAPQHHAGVLESVAVDEDQRQVRLGVDGVAGSGRVPHAQRVGVVSGGRVELALQAGELAELVVAGAHHVARAGGLEVDLRAPAVDHRGLVATAALHDLREAVVAAPGPDGVVHLSGEGEAFAQVALGVVGPAEEQQGHTELSVGRGLELDVAHFAGELDGLSVP